MEEIQKLINELPNGLNFIIDDFGGCYLVGVYIGRFTPAIKKHKTDLNEEQKIQLQKDCLNEFFVKFKDGYYKGFIN